MWRVVLPSVAVTAVALVVALGPAAESATADTPGCVTKREFRSVSKGVKKRRVHRVFDTRGRRVDYVPAGGGYPAEQVRVYNPCRNDVDQINAGYVKKAGVWRLKFKNWIA